MKKDYIQYALLAAAAYLVYRNWGQISAMLGLAVPVALPPPAPTPAPSPGTPGGGSGGQPGARPPTAPPVVLTVAEKIKAAGMAAMGVDRLTADQWCFFYKSVTTKACPAPEEFGFTGEGRFAPVSFDTWWGRLLAYLPSSAGMLGLGWGGNLAYGYDQPSAEWVV